MENKKLRGIELSDEDLEQVTGGQMDYTDQYGAFTVGCWVSNYTTPDYLYKVTTILFDTETGPSSVHFKRYWYDRSSNKAWNFGTTTISASDSYYYSEASAPGQIDDTFTPGKPF